MAKCHISSEWEQAEERTFRFTVTSFSLNLIELSDRNEQKTTPAICQAQTKHGINYLHITLPAQFLFLTIKVVAEGVHHKPPFACTPPREYLRCSLVQLT